jgi:hypothetical protein
LISLVVVQSFIFSSISFAADSIQNKLAIPQAKQSIISPDNIVIEKDYGLIKSRFLGNSNKLIINIQDAHCNYEAQTNIINILETLIKNQSLSLISVEGADGLIDTTWFKAFPDEEVRKEVATYFMKKGEITGPEFLSITKNYPIKLFGAEDRASYIQNLNAFTSSYPLKADTEKYYNSIKTALNRLKGYIYSNELKAMDAKSQDYESKKIQFNDYIRFLQEMAERTRINLRGYENFFRLVSVLIYEKKIDFNVTDKERAGLIDELSKVLSKDALTDLVSQSISFKSGKISSVEFYNYLKKSALDNNIDLAKQYPNLYNYIIYNSVYSRIENEKLFHEIKKIETDIKEKLFTGDEQRTLDKLSRHIEILLGMVNIKLLNGDFSYYQTHKDEFSHEAFADFIKKEGEKYGLAYDVEPPTEAVAKSIPKLEDFYAIATKRDKALVDNTIKEMEKEKQQIAVLVTGGFHSEGMAKLLEKQGVSYIVVCPSITKDVPTPYIQILTNQRTPLEDILTSPDAAKKGMLAAMLLSQYAAISSAHMEALLAEAIRNTPEDKRAELLALIKDVVGREEGFIGGWLALSVSRWMTHIFSVARNDQYLGKVDVMKEAYFQAMEKQLEEIAPDKKEGIAKLVDAIKNTKIESGKYQGKTFEEIFAVIHERMTKRYREWPEDGRVVADSKQVLYTNTDGEPLIDRPKLRILRGLSNFSGNPADYEVTRLMDGRYRIAETETGITYIRNRNGAISAEAGGLGNAKDMFNKEGQTSAHANLEEQYKALLEIFDYNKKIMEKYITKAADARGITRDEVIAGMFEPVKDPAKIQEFISKVKARSPPKGKKSILAFGGGTGLLAAIKPLAKMGAHVRSVQCSIDDGGSTFKCVMGFIANGYGWMPSPGDPVSSIFEGFAATDKLYKILDAQGRIDVVTQSTVDGRKAPAGALGKIIYLDDDGEPYYLDSFQELIKKLLARIVAQTVLNQRGIGHTERTTRLSDDFVYFAASVMNIARIIDTKYLSPLPGKKTAVIAKPGASIRNLMLIGAMDYIGLIDIYHPKYQAGSREYMLSTDEDCGKFQVALDAMAMLAGIQNGKVSLSHYNPATIYSVHRDNVIFIETDPGNLYVLVVNVDKERGEVNVKMLDKDDPGIYTEEKMKKGEQRTVDIGGIKTTLTMTAEGNFAFKVNGSSYVTLVEPKNIEDTYINYEGRDRLIATDGTGMVRKVDGTGYKALDVSGKKIYVRSRFTAMQTHITETTNFSRMVDMGLVDRNGRRTNSKLTANKEILDAIRDPNTGGIVFGPGSLLTSIMPHLLVDGMVEALAERRAKNDIPILLIMNPNVDNESAELTITDMLKMIEEKSGKKIDDMFTDLVINKSDATKLEEFYNVPDSAKPADASWYVNQVMRNPGLIEELGLTHFKYLIEKFSNYTGVTIHILYGVRDRRFHIDNDDGRPITFKGRRDITLAEYLQVKFDEYLKALYQKPKAVIRTDAGQASKEAKKARGPLQYTADEIDRIKKDNPSLHIYRDIFLAGVEFAPPRSSEPPIPHIGFLNDHISFLIGEIFGLTSVNREIAQAYDKVYYDLMNDMRNKYWTDGERTIYLATPQLDERGSLEEDPGLFRLIFIKYKQLLVKQLTPMAHAYFDQLGLDGFRRVIDTVHIADNISKNDKSGLGITAIADVHLEKNDEIKNAVVLTRQNVADITNSRVQFNREKDAEGLFVTLRPIVRTRNFGKGSEDSVEAALEELKDAISDINDKLRRGDAPRNLFDSLTEIAVSSKPFQLKITGFEYSHSDGELYFTVEPVTEFDIDEKGNKTLKIVNALSGLPTEIRQAPMHITLGRVTRPLDPRQINALNDLFEKLNMADLPPFLVDQVKVVIYSHRILADENIVAQPLRIGEAGQRLNFDALLSAAQTMLMANRIGAENNTPRKFTPGDADRATFGDNVAAAVNALNTNEDTVSRAMVASINNKKLLDDMAESVGISAVAALEKMAEAGLVTITDRNAKTYALNPDFFRTEKLDRLIGLLVASSMNPGMVDLSMARVSGIIINAINDTDFIPALTQFTGQAPVNVASALRQNRAFPTVAAKWQFSFAQSMQNRQDQPVRVTDFIAPQAAQYYENHGIGVEFSIPQETKADKNLLTALTQYQNEVIADMARGGYNYRGAGTKQTVEQFFNDYFKKEWYAKIRSFVSERFNEKEPLKYIITNGIGANDQFMWALVNMYNANRPENAPVWYHVTTARDFANLLYAKGIKGENSLLIDISRSGGTWEGVEVGIRSLVWGFNKRIALANGGAVSEIAKRAAELGGYNPLIIGMSPDIGGRNMHRKTTIYYTAQTVAGMFLPSMNSEVFAGLNDRFDKANDFGTPDNNLAVSAGKFLHGAMRLSGVEHIAFITNTEPLRLIATEWEQYIMEGSNKEDIITMGIHDLRNEPSSVLSNMANSPAGRISIGMVILDKASPNYTNDNELVNSLKAKMPMMIFTINSSKRETPEFRGEMNPEQQAAFDILWTDLVTVFTSLLKVDANSNPNVKVVREETAKRVAAWKAAQAGYNKDAVSRGGAKVLVSYGNPSRPGISTEGSQVELTTQNAEAKGAEFARQLAEEGMLKGRNRLNLFVGRNDLLPTVRDLRVETYNTELAKRFGWIIQTGLFPIWSHKGLEANLGYSENPARPLPANRTINLFFNARSLGTANEFFNQTFNNMEIMNEKFAGINGATVHQTNDAMTMPNVKRMAEVSPTILFEFMDNNRNIEAIVSAFYRAFVNELAVQEAKTEALSAHSPGETLTYEFETMTVEDIHTNITMPSIEGLLNKTVGEVVINHDKVYANEGKVLIIWDEGINPNANLVAQQIGHKLDHYLGDVVVNLRVKSDELLEKATTEAAKKGFRAVITITKDETINVKTGNRNEPEETVGDALQKLHTKSKILSVQGDALPVPVLYDVALRYGFNKEFDADFTSFLQRVFLDAVSGKPIDPARFLNDVVVRLISRIKPADIDGDEKVLEMAAKAVGKAL